MAQNPRMAEWFARLKELDLHEVAARLGMRRDGGRGNYFSPARKEKQPSLSIHGADKGRYGAGWKDHTTGNGGTAIDLVIYAGMAGDHMEAARLLGDWFGLPIPSPDTPAAPARKSTEEWIADRCLQEVEPVLEYLQGRGITEAALAMALKNRMIGWNNWTSNKVPAGEPGHGGAAAAFIVRTLNPGRVVAVDMRYQDPGLNGGVKTQCQGEKSGYGWYSDLGRLKRAHTVYIVESPINALSVESCYWPEGYVAYAIRGTGNVESIDFSFLRGKKVLIALDHTDPVKEGSNTRPGLAAAWRLNERLTALDIANRFVNMLDWEEGQDINDVLQAEGPEGLGARLKQIEPWLIPGNPAGAADEVHGRRRIWLPTLDWNVYWRFRQTDDFTQYVQDYKDCEDEDGKFRREEKGFGDLCAFRIAGISRLRIQSHLATINGTPDNQPETVFGVSAQVARHGNTLQRAVITDDKIFSLDWWAGRFGYIWKPKEFARMISILERTADIGARDVVNFVGLAWRGGELAALEGNDCYFTEPARQCLYHNLSFPRGGKQAARQVIAAYQETFKHNAAAIPMVWALGAHLKMLLGFYPHFEMQADKGSGKSKLMECMQRSFSFQVLSGQMLKTDHRRRASVSYTTNPVGWDEFSKLPKSILTDIDGLLQSTYRFEFTRIGAALTPYLMCAPVLLAGEEVDIQSLQSKVCRSKLTVERQGPMIPHELPQFPVWPWLQFLAGTEPARIRDLHKSMLRFCQAKSRAGDADATSNRMMENYAAILAAWHLLCEFAEIDAAQGHFVEDLLAEMNSHLSETDGTRLPWVRIMEIALSELDARRFEHPFCWEDAQDDEGNPDVLLYIRPNHIMDHLSTANHLRAKFDGLPVKTGRIFKSQLLASGVVAVKRGEMLDDVEKTIDRRRIGHMTAISLNKLEALGLSAAPEIKRDIP
ncbi:toprim domain-containing protein [Chromobacterium vaccinii]|nr:toprim domain-containing protein [Chromobacterium vaccinii]